MSTDEIRQVRQIAHGEAVIAYFLGVVIAITGMVINSWMMGSYIHSLEQCVQQLEQKK